MAIFAPNTEVFGSICPLCPKHEHLAHFQGHCGPTMGVLCPLWIFFDANNTHFLLFNMNLNEIGVLIIILATYAPITWTFFLLSPFFPEY